MGMIDWAKREIEIAKARERETSGNTDYCDYGCACYDSALKAFESLCEDGHSGSSIMATKWILNRLIDGKVLTPIEDTPDVWKRIADNHYQCKRMSSLFKRVDGNGNISYSDNNYAVMVDVIDRTTWHSGFIDKYVYSKYPIVMPYMPISKPYKVYSEDFYYKHPGAVGEYDHKALLYMVKPDGKREEINKYFMEQDGEMVEITPQLYYEHREETLV